MLGILATSVAGYNTCNGTEGKLVLLSQYPLRGVFFAGKEHPAKAELYAGRRKQHYVPGWAPTIKTNGLVLQKQAGNLKSKFCNKRHDTNLKTQTETFSKPHTAPTHKQALY
ncbi:MAG: hypothetical protein H0U39_07600 [Segetibacter sp.]|nr:hypothetical protein [Segetibacter sp.]